VYLGLRDLLDIWETHLNEDVISIRCFPQLHFLSHLQDDVARGTLILAISCRRFDSLRVRSYLFLLHLLGEGKMLVFFTRSGPLQPILVVMMSVNRTRLIAELMDKNYN
jgi:hypothetical protein